MKNILISQSKLFRSWPKESRDYIVSKSKILNFSPKQFVYMEGDISRDIYLVIKGIFSEIQIQVDGTELNKFDFEQGDIFGEIGFIDRLPRDHSVISRTRSEVIAIPRTSYIDSIQNMTFEVFWDFLTIIAEKNKNTSKTAQSAPPDNLEGAVFNYLSSLNSKTALIKISQQEIADAVGTTRSNVSKALNKLEKENVIKKQYSSIIINDNKINRRVK